jgi:hypothetical protein
MIRGERCYLEPQPHKGPVALVPVLQLYARDLPELPFPESTDLFQLLWCPNWHGEPWHGPALVTIWRRAAEVTEPLPTRRPPGSRTTGSGVRVTTCRCRACCTPNRSWSIPIPAACPCGRHMQHLLTLYLNLGRAHEQLGDNDQAAQWYQRAAERTGDLPEGSYADMV